MRRDLLPSRGRECERCRVVALRIASPVGERRGSRARRRRPPHDTPPEREALPPRRRAPALHHVLALKLRRWRVLGGLLRPASLPPHVSRSLGVASSDRVRDWPTLSLATRSACASAPTRRRRSPPRAASQPPSRTRRRGGSLSTAACVAPLAPPHRPRPAGGAALIRFPCATACSSSSAQFGDASESGLNTIGTCLTRRFRRTAPSRSQATSLGCPPSRRKRASRPLRGRHEGA